MSKYLALFVSEATEHLEALSRELVQLESRADAELLASLFRHAHSVKGMSAAMGFQATATLAHRVEDILMVLRDSPTKGDRPTIDLLLQGVDALQRHAKSAPLGQFEDVTPLLEQLGQRFTLLSGQPIQPTRVADFGAPAPSPAPPPLPQGLQRYVIELQVLQSSATPAVRGFLAYRRLTTLGQVFGLTPPLDELKVGKLPGNRLGCELETHATLDEVKQLLATIGEIEPTVVRPTAAQPPLPPPEPSPPVIPPPVPSPGPPPAPTGSAPRAPPSAPGAPAEGNAPRVVGHEAERTVRVRAAMLDELLEGVGELLLASSRVREVGRKVQASDRPLIDDAVDRVYGLARELHDKVMQARMTPLSVITDRLPRATRDIARRRGREVSLTIDGADIELDRSTVDELADPLLHLIRNAVDHGIEPATDRQHKGKSPAGSVAVRVRRLRDRVELDVVDDGKGLDAEKLKAKAIEKGHLTVEAALAMGEAEAFLLCCLPGISTAADVSDISGRGVGMDAVKRAVERAGGHLGLTSEKDHGTTVRLTLPLTVAVVQLLLVGLGDEVVGLPITRVAGVVERPQAGTVHFGQAELPVHALESLLQLPGKPKPGPQPHVVIEGESGRLALRVDALLGQAEVVVKPLTSPLDQVPGLSGVTILGDGRPLFILDVPRLVSP